MNQLVPELDESAFAMTLAAKPAVISFALGDPGELVKRAHDAGSLVVHQVTTVLQARQAAERGVDVIIAQAAKPAAMAARSRHSPGSHRSSMPSVRFQWWQPVALPMAAVSLRP